MKSENLSEVQLEDKSTIRRFFWRIFLGMLFGAGIGLLSCFIKRDLVLGIEQLFQGILHFLTPYGNVFLLLAEIFIVGFFYGKSRKIFKQWDGDKEEELEKMECLLSYGLWFIALTEILSFFFFAIGFPLVGDREKYISFSYMAFWLGGFILVIAGSVAAKQKMINLVKEINPEKKGSIFDEKFAKKWEESCDEAEKYAIYKSSYHAYQCGSKACIFLWVFCVIGSSIWNFGPLPVTMVSVIWGVLVTGYCREAIRLTRKKKV